MLEGKWGSCYIQRPKILRVTDREIYERANQHTKQRTMVRWTVRQAREKWKHR